MNDKRKLNGAWSIAPRKMRSKGQQKRMTANDKKILRSVIVTVGLLMFLVGSLTFLVFLDHELGRSASIWLLCSGVVVLIAALISQNTEQQGFPTLIRRIVDSYKAVAIVILNTLILFACLELVAIFANKVWEEPAADDDTQSPRAHTPYYASQPWAKQYWEEFTLSHHVLYRDYVLWRRGPFTGKFVNINSDGIRVTPGADCGANSYKVFTFGGSTMWGTGAPDWGSIPGYLQADFNALKRGPVCVVNFAESAYVSTQGVIQLMLELQSGNIPDLFVSYEGANDVYAAYQSGRSTHQNSNQIADRLNKAKNSPQFITWIESTNSFHLSERLMARLRRKAQDRPALITYKTTGIDTETLTGSMVGTYLGNYKLVEALAQAYGFKFLFFWQPQVAVGTKPLTSEELEMRRGLDPDLIEFYESTYRRVQQVAKKYENLYYIADTFDSSDFQIYIDQVHVTPVGNRLIAERIFRIIMERDLLDHKNTNGLNCVNNSLHN
jgi:lysophospholipase L1-like esterase